MLIFTYKFGCRFIELYEKISKYLCEQIHLIYMKKY